MSRARTRLRLAVASGAALAALTAGALPATATPAPAAGADATARHLPWRPPFLQPTAIRQIPLQGAVNVRDLGGYRTYTGGTVRPGLVYRADSLSKLTDADLTTVAGLKLTKVVDFRVPLELQYDGADRLPVGLTATSRSVDDKGLYGTITGTIATRDPVRQEAVFGGGRGAALMGTIYEGFVDNPANRAQFAATLREIADGKQGPLLYHCTSGKDRTGWLSYVLLRALAVPESAARQDFLASNTFRAAADARLREGLRQSGMMQNPDLLIPIQEVRPEYLDAANARVEAAYGDFGGYLTKGLGLDVRTLAKLQDKLVR
ncbi:tyrosine-protein phosphatase [Streptomyces sp. BI20]|uniref:tyrosine-protein phosphatase n=1 Tax=Streptomyces sp. BI20 TaxID=3403460 RepID=UPI003C7330F5